MDGDLDTATTGETIERIATVTNLTTDWTVNVHIVEYEEINDQQISKTSQQVRLGPGQTWTRKTYKRVSSNWPTGTYEYYVYAVDVYYQDPVEAEHSVTLY